MTKRRVYAGLYTRRPKPLLQGAAQSSYSPLVVVKYLGKWQQYSKMAHDYLTALYTLMSGNYLVIATIFFVVVLSFLLPDITQKLQATEELKDVQKVLDKISNEVKQAEVACLTVADEICCLHCTMHDGTTETVSIRSIEVLSKDLRDLSVCTSRVMRATQSEPAQIEREIGFFRRVFFPNRNASRKEVTLMSYVYTDSFEGRKQDQSQ